jgi:hypothetical protein
LGTTLFVVPGGHYEAVLRNYEANNRVKNKYRVKLRWENKNLKKYNPRRLSTVQNG